MRTPPSAKFARCCRRAKERKNSRKKRARPSRVPRCLPQHPQYPVVWIEDPELALLWNRRRSRLRQRRLPFRERNAVHVTRGAPSTTFVTIPRSPGGWVDHLRHKRATCSRGNRICRPERTHRHHDSKSEASILAALQLSAEKWGRFGVRGSDAYKETCARLAAEHASR